MLRCEVPLKAVLNLTQGCPTLVEIKEYVIDGFIKVLVVCSEEPHVVGDLPALPFCFNCSKLMAIGDAILCYSDEITLPSGAKAVIEGARVLEELRSVAYVIKGVNCPIDPEALHRELVELIGKLCSKRETQGGPQSNTDKASTNLLAGYTSSAPTG